MKDIFMLNIPNFEPIYKKGTSYGYEGKKGENLKKLLIETSRGYCMYCYTRILVDRKNFGQLEHSIEKSNCEKLINCRANISITCSKCNLSFKKKGEELRKLSKEELDEFQEVEGFEESECAVDCIYECKKHYDKLKKNYNSKQGGEIILQPFGIKTKDKKTYLYIQYDILNQKFVPSKLYNYTEEEIEFIEKHINRFNLNEPSYKTKEFKEFILDIIEYKCIPKKNRYNNLVVELFIGELEKLPNEKALKLCENIYSNLLITGNI